VSAIREQILAAALVALNTGAPSGTPVSERCRTDSLNKETLDAIIIYPGTDQASDVGGRAGPIRRRSLEVIVECWAQETADQSADQVATRYAEWAVKALEDNRLGGLASGLRESETRYALDVGEVAFALATVVFAAEYQHKAGDLTLRA
jgi:hypothetical protein